MVVNICVFFLCGIDDFIQIQYVTICVAILIDKLIKWCQYYLFPNQQMNFSVVDIWNIPEFIFINKNILSPTKGSSCQHIFCTQYPTDTFFQQFLLLLLLSRKLKTGHHKMHLSYLLSECSGVTKSPSLLNGVDVACLHFKPKYV